MRHSEVRQLLELLSRMLVGGSLDSLMSPELSKVNSEYRRAFYAGVGAAAKSLEKLSQSQPAVSAIVKLLEE